MSSPAVAFRLNVAAALLGAGWLAIPLSASAQTALPEHAPLPLPPDPAGWQSSAGRAPEIRAQLSPHRQTVLSSELAGKIVELPVKEGERFKSGQVLVALDCAEHKARLDRARAQEDAAGKKLEIIGRLEKLNSVSRIEMDDALAQLAMSKAETALNQVYVNRCAIVAPFAGRVAAKHVQRYQFVGEGEKLLELIDDGELELEMIVPSHWLTWLAPGQTFQVRVDEIGRSYPAEVTRLGARIDPISQSVKVFGRIAGNQDGLLAGMSGSVEMPVPVPAVAGASAGGGSGR